MAPKKQKSTHKPPALPKTLGKLSTGLVLHAPTSSASRVRARHKLSKESVLSPIPSTKTSSSTEITNYVFDPESTVHFTWGPGNTAPITAVTSTRRRRGYRSLGAKSASSRFLYGNPASLSDPAKSFQFVFLDLPFEIRERVLGYITSPKNTQTGQIVLHKDLTTVLRPPRGLELAIARTSKQLAAETGRLLFAKFTFLVLAKDLSLSPSLSIGGEMPTIPVANLTYLKTVVLELPKGNCTPKWCMMTALCIQRLVKAGARLNTLSLVFSPEVLPTNTVGVNGEETSQDREGKGKVTFASFFFTGSPTQKCSPLITVLNRLSCQKLILILRLSSSELPQNRAVIELDVSRLGIRRANPRTTEGVMPGAEKDDVWVLNDEVAMQSRASAARSVQAAFRQLQGRIEAMTVDVESVVRSGDGRLLVS